jgi:hypothetical protein
MTPTKPTPFDRYAWQTQPIKYTPPAPTLDEQIKRLSKPPQTWL